LQGTPGWSIYDRDCGFTGQSKARGRRSDFAIPTLVRKFPEPLRKIIGDLSNEEKVLVGLNIRPAGLKKVRHEETNRTDHYFR
jgi:hypothetical protein